MKKIYISILLTLFSSMAVGQTNPPPVAAFQFNGSLWSGVSTTITSGALGFQPPSAAMYCINASNAWAPCNFGSTGGTGIFLDKGGAIYNVQAYGAVGDGVTNDCAAITLALSALTTAKGGVLYFPHSPGAYFVGSSCHFNITVATIVDGAGACSLLPDPPTSTGDPTLCGAEIISTDGTGVLFNDTATKFTIRNIGLVNLSASAPTSGSGILATSTSATIEPRVDHIYMDGFFDDIDYNVDRLGKITNSYITNPVRYGIYLQNTVNNDFGDCQVTGNTITGSYRTLATTTAGIEYDSGAGCRIGDNKIVQDYTGNFQNGIRMNTVQSPPGGQTLIWSNDIEGLSGTGNPINIVAGWPNIQIENNHLTAASGNSAINIVNPGTTFISGGFMLATASTTNAITISGTGSGVTIMPFGSGNFTNLTSIGGGITSVIDLSGLTGNSGNLVVPVTVSAASGVFSTSSTVTNAFSSTSSSNALTLFGGTSASLNMVGPANSFVNQIYWQGGSVNSSGVYSGGTQYWALGFLGGTSWNLADQQNSHTIVSFPSNTMPASSLTGGANGVILGGAGPTATNIFKGGNTTLLTADTGNITATTAATATTVFTLPSLIASTNYSIHCSGTTTQATAGAGIGIAVKTNTTAATNMEFHAVVNTSATAINGQSSGSLSTTTESAIYTGVAGTLTTQLPWTVDGSIEVGATAPTSIVIGFFTANASDAVVVKRDSYCTVNL